MSTHDAGKLGGNPADRRTMTRDPNGSGGAIVEDGEKNGLKKTIAGSTHLTTNIDGKWFVCDTRGNKLIDTSFDTETEAVQEAQKHNHNTADNAGASATDKPAV